MQFLNMIPIPLAYETSVLPHELHPHDISSLYKLNNYNGISVLQLMIQFKIIFNVINFRIHKKLELVYMHNLYHSKVNG